LYFKDCQALRCFYSPKNRELLNKKPYKKEKKAVEKKVKIGEENNAFTA
jgi:hypothetical protein